MKIGQLRDGSRSWLDVEVGGLEVLGRLAPRFTLRLILSSPAEGIQTTLKALQVDLLWQQELLGTGIFLEGTFSQFEAHRTVELPTSRLLIQEITDRLGTDPNIPFQVRFGGTAEVLWQPGVNVQRFVGDPEPGSPTVVTFGSGQNSLSFSVTRGEWFERIVAKLGDADYVPMELLVPRGKTGEAWRQTLSHVSSARRAYALGDDPSAFVHLRGALGALPGAKQHIFEALPEPKRTEVNKLVLALGQFLHTGRHVSDQGAEPGAFPVDHVDAGFALNLMTVLLSYASRALEAAGS